MPAPPLFRDRLAASLSRMLPRIIDRAWDGAEEAQKALRSKDLDPRKSDAEKLRYKETQVKIIADGVSESVQKSFRLSPRKPRLRQGEAREAVKKVIAMFPEEGIDRDGIRQKVRPHLNGTPLSENTLRRVLMDLRRAGTIYTKNSHWFPGDADNIGFGRVRTQPRYRDPNDH